MNETPFVFDAYIEAYGRGFWVTILAYTPASAIKTIKRDYPGADIKILRQTGYAIL